MVWLEFNNSPAYLELSKALMPFADKTMLKPFPHITLVRFNEADFANLKKLLPAGGLDISSEIKPIEVSSIDIMESHLNREGAHYEIISRYKLSSGL
jgi:2'-5' RNA ligase